jgi:hypothetical protein
VWAQGKLDKNPTDGIIIVESLDGMHDIVYGGCCRKPDVGILDANLFGGF